MERSNKSALGKLAISWSMFTFSRSGFGRVRTEPRRHRVTDLLPPSSKVTLCACSEALPVEGTGKTLKEERVLCPL